MNSPDLCPKCVCHWNGCQLTSAPMEWRERHQVMTDSFLIRSTTTIVISFEMHLCVFFVAHSLTGQCVSSSLKNKNNVTEENGFC